MDAVCRDVLANLARAVVGYEQHLELLLVALLAEGHVLLDDVPGVGKTLMAKALAASITGCFSRVQFTPDLQPSDVTGYNIYNQERGALQFQPGPVFANVLLADELNRTLPRTQASLLESMEERQVTIDGETMPLPSPFFVIATQNPIDSEGTFPLPEAQLDRFLLRLRLGYPSREEEMDILARFVAADPLAALSPVASPAQLEALQRARRDVRVSDPLRGYVTDLVRATRAHAAVAWGASPRASMALVRSGQALALLRGRDHVLPDDVKSLVAPALAHRLVLDDGARMRGQTPEAVLSEVVAATPVPLE